MKCGKLHRTGMLAACIVMLTIATGCGTGTEENNGSIQTVQETIPEENQESNSEGNPEVNPEDNPEVNPEGKVQKGAGEPQGEAADEGIAEGNRADKETKATDTNGTERTARIFPETEERRTT